MQQVDKRFTMGTKLSPPDERHLVWETLYNPHIPNTKNQAHQIWSKGLPKANFKKEILLENLYVPGWRFVNVEGKVDEKRFWTLLSQSVFPINMQLRHLDEVDYCVLRDTFHDTVGHVPPLFNKMYSETMRYFGTAGVRLYRSGDRELRKQLTRLYWASIEFSGMVDTGHVVRPLGAGIVSSKGETAHFFEQEGKHRYFDLDEIIEWEYDVEGFQDRYYIIQEWEQVNKAIDKILLKKK